MKIGLKQLLLTTAIAATVAPFASAQENPFIRGRYTDVVQRAQPEFDPEPVRVGGFVVDSSIGVGAEYNDNIFAEPNNEDDDTIVRVTPRIEARSDWLNHELSAGASVNHREYASNDSETSTDYNLFVHGRIDASRDLQFRVGADAGHITEPRYAAASFGALEPASLDNTALFGEAVYRRDRIQIEGTVGVSEDEYEQLSQNIRDNTRTFINGRISYALTPDVAGFVQARQTDLDYSQAARDGTQTTLEAGVNFELTAPFRGEIAVGHFKDDKDSPLFGDVDGLNVRANAKWFPSQLTTVTVSADRGTVDPGLATSATSVNTVFGLRIDHELLRNILLFGDIRQENSDFQGAAIDREDDALALAVGGAYKLNKHAHVELRFSTRSQDSTGLNAGPDLDVNVISAGIRFYP